MQYKLYKSQEWPESLTGFKKSLQAEHSKNPFSPVDLWQATVERVEDVAEAHGLNYWKIAGEVSLQSVGLKRDWLVIDTSKDDQEESLLVVDIALPLHSQEFTQKLLSWVFSEITTEELKAVAYATNFNERTLGVIPESVKYLGQAA